MRRAALNLLGEDEGAQRATASVLLRVGNNGYFGQVWSAGSNRLQRNSAAQSMRRGVPHAEEEYHTSLNRISRLSQLSMASRIYQWHLTA